jgi:glycosyltransferase involved in cell wall biosynthesis
MASWSGVGRYSVGISGALARHPEVEPVLVLAANESVPELLCDCERHHVEGHPFSPAGSYHFSETLQRVKPDLTHCLHFPTPFPATHPLVVTMHDLTPLLVPGVMPSGAKRAIYRYAVRRAVHVADRIVTLSEFSLEQVSSVFPSAASKGRVTLAGADDFAAGPVAILEGRLAEIAGASYVLSMGSTRPHKDLPTLLSAFAALAAERADLRLVLAGTGEDGYLDAQLAGVSEDVRSRVSFTGSITDDELRALYTHAELLAFPSRYEGFGLPPLEAMALGTPVVTTNAASLPEVVGKKAALVVDPGDATALADAIAQVLDKPATRRRLVKAGHARAEELTWAAAAERTVEVYRELLG